MIASLANAPGRCDFGFHIETQHPGLCACRDGSEWALFVKALKAAVDMADDGLLHQRFVRPLIRGRITPKHIGQCWKKARDEQLVVEAGHERSNDREGRNAGRMEPYYRLEIAA